MASFAGVSLIGDNGGRASRSVSAITGGVTASGYHLLVVDGYLRTKEDYYTGKCIKSQPFKVGGYSWIIEYYPKPKGEDPEDADSISLYLSLEDNDDDVVTENTKVHFEFSFADQVEKQSPSAVLATEPWSFNDSAFSSWGYPSFIKREALEKSRHLKDDRFTIRCDVIVINGSARTEDAGAAPFIEVPPSDIIKDFGLLLRTQDGADLVIEVGGETFSAHRCVLAIRSRLFRSQLFGTRKDCVVDGTIRIDDMESKVFKALLTFIYTDSPGIEEEDATEQEDKDQEMSEGGDDDKMVEGNEEREGSDNKEDVKEKKVMFWQNLLAAADRYSLRRLELICAEKLLGFMDTSTVITFLVLAEKHFCSELKKACLDFLKSKAHMQKVIAAGGLDHLTAACPSVLEELIGKHASQV